ncbi:MAG: mechanosensitive ion channel family protein [Xenococcaceae cyanobacterium]
MTDQASLDFAHLSDLILKSFHALERPVVQIQLLGIAMVISLAWLTSKGIWIQLQRRFLAINYLEWSGGKLSRQQYAAALFRYLFTSVLSLVAVNLLRKGFLHLGLVAGLLTVAIKILWVFLFYRGFLLGCYAAFPTDAVSRYRFWFFAPLFIFFVIRITLSLLTDVEQLAQVVPVKLFGTPVTLGAILVTTVGLYFWIVGVFMIENLLLYFFSAGTRLEPGAGKAASLIIRYLLIGLGIVLIFGYVGFNATALAAITGGLSVGIGFGLKEVISNFLSGIWLLFEGSLKPGDVINVGGELSQVKELGVRAATVQVTRDNSKKIIPNQLFFTEEITTYTGSDHLVYRSLSVGASYECDPQKVLDILLQVARQHPKVLKDPAPRAFFVGFGSSSLDFELKFWLDDPLIGKTVTSEVGCAVWQAFAENHIEIPYPQRDLHLRSDDRLESKSERSLISDPND